MSILHRTIVIKFSDSQFVALLAVLMDQANEYASWEETIEQARLVYEEAKAPGSITSEPVNRPDATRTDSVCNPVEPQDVK